MHSKRLDLEAALNRLGGDHELLDELVLFFLEDAPVLLDQVRDGIRQHNTLLVERGAHSLKGLAANFGADHAAQTAWIIEQLGQEGNLAAASEAIPALEAEVHALEQALVCYRQSAARSSGL